jgi:hypothetical protein
MMGDKMMQRCGYKGISIKDIPEDLRKGRHPGKWLAIMQEIDSKKIKVAEIIGGNLSALALRSRISSTIRLRQLPYVVKLRNNKVYVVRKDKI